jgi:hypothetical protein
MKKRPKAILRKNSVKTKHKYGSGTNIKKAEIDRYFAAHYGAPKATPYKKTWKNNPKKVHGA